MRGVWCGVSAIYLVTLFFLRQSRSHDKQCRGRVHLLACCISFSPRISLMVTQIMRRATMSCRPGVVKGTARLLFHEHQTLLGRFSVFIQKRPTSTKPYLHSTNKHDHRLQRLNKGTKLAESGNRNGTQDRNQRQRQNTNKFRRTIFFPTRTTKSTINGYYITKNSHQLGFNHSDPAATSNERDTSLPQPPSQKRYDPIDRRQRKF